MTERSERTLVKDRLASIVRGQQLGDLIGGPSTLASPLLESVHSIGRFDADDVRRRYVDWWISDGFDTGPVADAVFSRIAGGADAADAVEAVHWQMDVKTAGCGPAHRNVVLASVDFIDDKALEDCVRSEAALTHFHHLAAATCVAAVRICRRLAHGERWNAALETSSPGLSDEVASAILLWRNEPSDRTGYAPAVLHASLHFVGTGETFDNALDRSTEFSGSANYVPVLAGAIAGARWGIAE